MGGSCSQSMTTLNYSPANDTVAIIDGYLSLRPKLGYAFTPSNEIIIATLWAPTGSFQPIYQTMQLQNVEFLMDIMAMPDADGFYALAFTGTEQILVVDPVNQTQDVLAEVENATDLVVGDNRNIYVTTGEEIVCLNPAFEAPQTAIAYLPEWATTIAYCDLFDEVIALSASDDVLMFYDPSLEGEPVMQDLPDIPWGDGIYMVCDPPHVGDRIWIATSSQPHAYAFRRGVTEPVEVVSFDWFPKSLDIDDAGHLFIGTNDGVLELFQGVTGGWTFIPPSEGDYAEMPPNSRFLVTRSRTNYDEDFHYGPGWEDNIEPEELLAGSFIPDCDGDLSSDGVVDGSDLGLLLANWGAGGIGDLDGDGTTDGTDLGLLLSVWGECPGAQAAPCAGDVNGDGVVDGADLGFLLGEWDASGGADLNGDGTVDGADLGMLLAEWGDC
jgi:hypothetical protein